MGEKRRPGDEREVGVGVESGDPEISSSPEPATSSEQQHERPEGGEPSEPTGESGGPARSSAPPASAPRPSRSSKPPRAGLAWALPVKRFADMWTRFEVRLAASVLVAEILALCAWVLLKGLSLPPSTDSRAGVIVRGVVGATLLGVGAYLATRKRGVSIQRAAILPAIGLGLVTAPAWEGVGSAFFSNVLNWLQDASALTLMGGLRGLGTRLTVWLAMLGGSLAAASGKHIHIDVVRRFLPERLRIPATVTAWASAALVCLTAAWGFTDHIAIESYDVDRDAKAGEKVSAIGHHASQAMFVLRKQLALDVSTLPSVLKGERYDSWLTNEEWNRRIENAGWEEHFTAEQVQSMRMPPEMAQGKRAPVVIVPGSTHTGMLVHLLNLVFPFGFIFIALRLLLRAFLIATGHASAEPDVIGREDVQGAAEQAAREGGAR